MEFEKNEVECEDEAEDAGVEVALENEELEESELREAELVSLDVLEGKALVELGPDDPENVTRGGIGMILDDEAPLEPAPER